MKARSLILFVERELCLSFTRAAQPLAAVFFSLVIASLFPFALDHGREMAGTSAVGVAWVSALLASLLTLDSLYLQDQEDGTYDLLLLSSFSSLKVVAGKALAHMMVSGLPLTLSGAVCALMLQMPPQALPALLTSLLLGLVYMSLLGGMGAILSMGARRPGLLLSLLIFPLYMPMLIFGVSAAQAAVNGMPAKPYLLLQLALIIAAAPLILTTSATVLRLHVRS